MQITFSTKLQHQQPHSKVAESENIRANHLGFTKFLFQHYCQYLGLTHNHILAELAFNFYVNEKIAYLLRTSMNIESARETFYNKLIQNTSLPINHNFASIITEINKEIEHHIQQRYPITYTSKGKGKLQTPAKTRIKSSNNPSYYYTPGSAINISLTDASASNVTSTFGCFPFQSKQRKKDLLGPYGEYFKGFKSQSLMPSGFQSPPPQPNFGIMSLWKITESERGQEVEEEKKSKDHKFTYQNPILENPESKTPNFQTQPNLDNQKNNTPNIQTPPNQNNPNFKVINQYLPSVIVIDQPPVEPIGQPIQPQNQQNQQLLPVPPQQQQQLPPPQQQQMAYAPITKLDKFNSEEDDVQVWLNDIAKAITANNWDDAKAMQAIPYFLQNTTDAWYQSLAVKSQNFNGFKTEFLQYFSNNNSINKLANTFTMIRQGDTEAVTTYLECFYKNLRQIQAIQANYFTAPQILNQFIRGLHITYVRDFEAAKLEANHAQAVNLAINRSSELDSKLKQFSDSINQKLEGYLADNYMIYQPPQHCGSQRHVSATTVKPQLLVPNSEPLPESRPIPTYLPVYNVLTNLSTTSLSNSSLSIAATSNLSGAVTSNISTTATSNLSNTHYSNTTSKLSSNDIKEPKIKDHPKLEISNSSLLTSNQDLVSGIRAPGIKQQQPLINNIPPATITKNKSLDAIFPFKLEELSNTLLFSGVALEEKPITAIYTNAKVNGHSIKLILNSVDRAVSTKIITMDRATKIPIGKINDFLIEVNSIIVPIKVLVIEATQY
ncbi:hypothetical protein G9A89_012529 [Geosiphon pyriformis]|nr:hypothetical protein G9A89_012529 [Geosiphon pyriformis]